MSEGKKTVAERLATLEESQRTQLVVLDEIRQAVCGQADEPGLKGRVDRLETSIRVLHGLGAGILTVLGVIGTWIAWLKHRS